MSDDEYEIPLQDQRVFGAGIKRKRVHFVPSTSNRTSSIVALPTGKSAQSVSDKYLQMVLPGNHTSTAETSLPRETSQMEAQLCDLCSLPLTSTPPSIESEDNPRGETAGTSNREPLPKQRPHEALLAHQVCLTHSHPPSHLDRNRKGLAYLSSYGWDPDSRLGLGASGQGIQFPIKTKPKDDKMGIGVVLPKESERKKKEKVQKLDAGKVKKLYEHDKKKAEKLRELFYRNDDVERYLGSG